MLKNYFTGVIACMVLLLTGCSKKQTNSFTAYVKGTIGGVSFTSSKDNVSVGESPTVPGGTTGGTEQVDITASDDVSGGSYVVIDFGYTANDIRSYSVPAREALCAYHKNGAVSDDVATTGTVTITANDAIDVAIGKHLTGSFDFTTQLGVHITGTFSVQVNY